MKRPGFTYIITHRARPRWIKIGATKDFNRRMGEYKSNLPPPMRDEWIELRVWTIGCPFALENLLHDYMRETGYEASGEWYRVPSYGNWRLLNRLDAIVKKFKCRKP